MRSPRIFVSIVSLWEIAIKHSPGGLRLRSPIERLLQEELEEQGYSLLSLAPEHVLALNRLPYPANGHRDPFDRMLVAQAQVERLELLSGDEALDAYAVRRGW